jgi:hypothetical protein
MMFVLKWWCLVVYKGHVRRWLPVSLKADAGPPARAYPMPTASHLICTYLKTLHMRVSVG